ncbi:MAG: hypothetical protein PWP23_2056 [Candidatus Sumerlaeota bacterium]|nr:hypothetical protein [Candidatus Sumerlaeota bacterium]
MHSGRITLMAALAVAGLCSCAPTGKSVAQELPVSQQAVPDSIDLATRYARISEFIGTEKYGEGGQTVLAVAYKALSEKHAAGEGQLVGLEDLWAHSLQEGLALFNRPDALWGKTSAEETADMIGQTTIGPWQMTISNVRHVYGKPYGVEPQWSDTEIYTYCRDRPEIQAKMIIDYIQLSYETFGRRSPYAIQRYFWLDPFVKGEIGQSSDWTRSVLAKPPPGGSWKDLTPAMKADTGFYAKQVLLGTSYTDSGLLFWLYVTGDTQAVRETLRTWRDQKRVVVASEGSSTETGVTIAGTHYVLSNEPGGFAVQEDDIIYYGEYPEINQAIRGIVREVASEERNDS